MENLSKLKDLSDTLSAEAFYQDIQVLNLSLNVCCTLSVKNNSISEYKFYDQGILVSTVKNIDELVNYYWKKIPLKVKKTELKRVLKRHFNSIVQKTEDLHLEIETLLSVSVLNFSNKNNLHISYWSSFPVLENQTQAQDYLDSVQKLAKMCLTDDELSHLVQLVQKVKEKLGPSGPKLTINLKE